MHFKPFNSWIRNPTSATALALHLLTSAFYAIVTHTYNYNYSLRNFRKFQFNVPGSNELVRSKWPGEWDAFLKKNKHKACLNSPYFFRNFWLQLNIWFPNYVMTQPPIQVNFHRLISSYARLSVHCTQTLALLHILFKIQSTLSKTDELRDWHLSYKEFSLAARAPASLRKKPTFRREILVASQTVDRELARRLRLH